MKANSKIIDVYDYYIGIISENKEDSILREMEEKKATIKKQEEIIEKMKAEKNSKAKEHQNTIEKLCKM